MARVGVIDLGTNSTRLLVADVEDGRVAELDRRSTVTRLGDGVDADARLRPDAVERVLATLAEYREVIDEFGAERVEAVATSAVRDSANGNEFLAELQERFGFEARALTGDEEARLTFLGATSRRTGGPMLVIDIGGGSTELVVGIPGGEPDFHVSTQAGSVRQSERHLRHDPPRPVELEELRRDVREIAESAIPSRVRARVTDAIAVAGTATSLAAVEQRLDPYDPAKVEGYMLELGACERMLAQLAAAPLERRRDTVAPPPAPAAALLAGAAILVEALHAFALEAAETSERDILHGVAISATA
jgi:exopolyphosphatase / guanosine-5'-triphosphate,3'-diphosphate pyrophosphatase